MSLERLQQFVVEANSTNSNNAKKEVIAKFPDLKDLFGLILHPLKPFNVTSKTIQKFAKDPKLAETVPPISSYQTLSQLLEALAAREVTGYDAVRQVLAFIRQNKNSKVDYRPLILNVIDKNLKTRTGASLINQVWDNCVYEFKVALGAAFDPDKHESEIYNLEGGDAWFVSRKLDGVRCLCFIQCKGEKCDIKFISRQGGEFDTLGKLADELRATFVPKLADLFDLDSGHTIVFDGEVCKMRDNREDFRGIMKEIKKKNHTVGNPRYLLFDCLTKDEFDSQTSNVTFSERIDTRLAMIGAADPQNNAVQVVRQVPCTRESFAEMSNRASEEEWEGLILRKNAAYKGKRSNDVLKVKKFYTEEYTVADIEIGPYRITSKTTGLQETIETVVSVVIDHKGSRVNVGSGFSLAERQEFYKDPTKIVGSVISVQYFEETENKEGVKSLRFPTFKGLYGKSRNF